LLVPTEFYFSKAVDKIEIWPTGSLGLVFAFVGTRPTFKPFPRLCSVEFDLVIVEEEFLGDGLNETMIVPNAKLDYETLTVWEICGKVSLHTYFVMS
jgi:hypothetical protein